MTEQEINEALAFGEVLLHSPWLERKRLRGVEETLRNLLIAANALNLEVNALRTERRWIPVEERLPEDMEFVLVLDGGIVTLSSRALGEWLGCCDSITHWMPLPEPPSR